MKMYGKGTSVANDFTFSEKGKFAYETWIFRNMSYSKYLFFIVQFYYKPQEKSKTSKWNIRILLLLLTGLHIIQKH